MFVSKNGLISEVRRTIKIRKR